MANGTPTDNGGSNPGRVDGGMRDPLAPQLTFVAPDAASDPNADTVVTGTSLTVRCQAARSSESGSVAVDKSSVAIMLVGDDGTKLQTPAMDALPNNEYEAKFDLSGVPNGPIRFACTASDADSPAHTDTVFLETLLDHGPVITLSSPTAKAYALKAPVEVSFSVEGVPLMDGDEEQRVSEVHLTVSGTELAVEETATPGVYHTSIDFDDQTLFPVAPATAEFVITAANSRTPTPATSEARVVISLDGDGPAIKVVSPIDGALVHGQVVLQLNITDPSGIKEGTVVAEIGSVKDLDHWTINGSAYSTTFDTLSVDNNRQLTQLSLNIKAADTAGNTTAISHNLKLDNLPPTLSIDPPFIREYHKVKVDNVDGKYCSALFDPVGDSVPNDLEVVSGQRRIRALVEDRTNAPLSTTQDKSVLYIAGVDTASIAVYLQPDPSIPLVLDLDGPADGNGKRTPDGYCDALNFDLLPKEQQPRKLQLSAVNVGGTPWYPLKDTADNAECYKPAVGMEMSTPPDPICTGTEMRRVIPGRVEGQPVALFAKEPTNQTGGECNGGSWELLTNAKEGWNCLVASGQDEIGNIGVSMPVRLCFDDPTTAEVPSCVAPCTFIDGTRTAVDPVACKKSAPSCTDGCTFQSYQYFTYAEGNQSWYFP